MARNSEAAEARARRTVPWLLLYVDFELLKLAEGVDWSWVRAHKKPYQDKITWLSQQIAPFDQVGPTAADLRRTTWAAWWDASQPEAELECYFDFEHEGHERHTIRARGQGATRRVRASFVFDLVAIEGSSREVGATAHRHVADALDTVAKHLRMPPPPSLPLTKKERQALYD